MALTTTTNRVGFAGNGTTTVWPYTFPIPDATYLSVIYTDADGLDTTLNTALYSVTGIGTTTGGNVTYPLVGSPIAASTALTLVRTVPYTQTTVFSNQGGYYPEVLEARLDLITMEAQQLADLFTRSLVAPASDAEIIAELPTSTQRINSGAGSLLGFSGVDGNPYAATVGSGSFSVNAWVSTNFFPVASAAAARTLFAVPGLADNNTYSGTQTFSAAVTLPATATVPTAAAGDSDTSVASTAFVQAATAKVYIQVFTATGTYTPHAGMVNCIIECVGGGGGGGGTASAAGNQASGGGGGGAGSYSKLMAATVTVGASQAVTIGAAGAAGTAGNNAGGNGGDTSVGTICIGKGGTGGAGSSGFSGSGYAAGGAGGVAGTGTVTTTGQPGGSTGVFNIASGLSGGGGSGMFGGGGVAATTATAVAGSAGTGHGSGGSGGASYNAGGTGAGGAGTAGYVVITEYCNQ